MNLKIFKNLFIYLLFTPLSLGIISCSGNNKSSSKLKEQINANFIPPISTQTSRPLDIQKSNK